MRFLASLLPVLAVVLLLATGCLNTQPAADAGAGPASTAAPRPTATAPPTPTPLPPRELRFAAGPNGSATQAFARAIADVWMARNPGLKVTFVNSSGQAENLRLLDDRTADVALARDDLAVLAANQQPPFEDRKITAAALAGTYTDVVQVIVGADSNITTSHNLVGKKISLPTFDSAADLTIGQVLAAGKFVQSDFASATHMSDEEAAAALRDKRIDAMLTAAPLPIPAVEQAAQQRPVRMVPINAAYRDEVEGKYSFFFDAPVPAGIYKGLDVGVDTVGLRNLIVVRRDMPEEVAYALARLLVEGYDDIAARNPMGKELKPDSITQHIATPFHEGAVRYYRDKGLVK